MHAVAADLTDGAGIAAACKEVEEALGPIDVLVNNAGVSREGPALSLGEEAFDDVMELLNSSDCVDELAVGSTALQEYKDSFSGFW